MENSSLPSDQKSAKCFAVKIYHKDPKDWIEPLWRLLQQELPQLLGMVQEDSPLEKLAKNSEVEEIFQKIKGK